MNSIFNKIILLFIIISLISCNDFLDQTPEHQIDLNSPVSSIFDVQIRVSGLYAMFQNKSYYGRSMAVLPDLMSDNSFVEKNSNKGNYLDYDDFNVNSTSFTAENLWTVAYRIVTSSNFLFVNISDDLASFNTIEEIDSDLGFTNPSDEEDFKDLIGQALTLRALAYFDLVRLYAQPYNFTSDASHIGIPIISNQEAEQILLGNTILPSRKTVKEVYQQIESDLVLATKLLKQNNGWNKVDYYTANALLSRVYLYSEEWEKSENTASIVLDSAEYELINTQDYVASWSEKSSSETIFSIAFTEADTNDLSSFGYYYVGTYDGGVSENFYNSIPINDVRQNLYSHSSLREMYLVRRKYDPSRERPYQSSFPIIRLSEVYLNRAEARVRLSKDNLALEDLNTIKERGLASNAIQNVNGAILLEQILKERRIELAFESHRLFDLTRNKKAFFKYKNREEEMPKEILYPNFRTILPIPQEEIDANINMVQNPGY